MVEWKLKDFPGLHGEHEPFHGFFNLKMYRSGKSSQLLTTRRVQESSFIDLKILISLLLSLIN